ncbi:MAG: ABC transporter substrate-binding protein [Betaproteobacteria bacterium]|nr:ABC transporter substrate-binding protein [Betaproteobacteria bacterium]
MSAAGDSAPVRLAIISEGVNAWPLYVAQARKLFESEGVAVDVTLTGSSTHQLEQLRSGGYDIGFQQSDHVVRAVETGSDLCIVMAQGHAPELSLVVASGIKSFADLRGRDIAVDGANSGYALVLRRLLAENGLGADDYRFVETGGSQERFDALKSGPCVASWLNPPFDRNLFAAGFGSLGTTTQFFPGYPGSIAAARRSWAVQNAERLTAFIRAFRGACHWLRDPANKAAAIALLPERLNISADLASRAFDAFVKKALPSIDAAGLQQVIDVYWEAEGLPEPRGVPAKYMDLSYQQRAGL